MFRALILGMWISAGCDAGSSVYAFHQGAIEKNPFVVSTRTVPFLLQTGAMVAGETFFAFQLKQRHPKLTKLLLLTHIGVGVYLTSHNIQIGNELKHGR